ncbi:MAG: hypothetical protein C0508_11665, partial [Cyanobacteria bacterium PR.023]|nr:hypothetical protein [Cyanobacteria bacterium PR.023]
MPHSKFSSSSRKVHSLLLSSLLASLPCVTTLVSQGLTNAALAQTNGPVAQVMPKQFLERYYQGVTYFKAGDLDKALAAFRAVVISAPYDPMVHLSLAAVLHQSGDLENAIAEYRRALSLRPADAFARMSLGGLLQSQGQLQEAVIEYDQAIKLRPDVVLFRLPLGIALRIAGNKDEAIHELALVVAAYPENLKALSQLAATYQDKG